MKFDEINKKAHHFTLERKDPNNENVPEAVIPEDKCLYFQPKEMLELRQFYKTEGYDAPFESLRDYAPDSYEENWWVLALSVRLTGLAKHLRQPCMKLSGP